MEFRFVGYLLTLALATSDHNLQMYLLDLVTCFNYLQSYHIDYIMSYTIFAQKHPF